MGPLAIAAIPAVAKAGFGIYQTIKGEKKLRDAKRPKYEIPRELLRNMQIAEQLAAEGLPEAQKMAYLQNVDRSAQMAMRGLSDRRAGVGAISNVQDQQNVAAQRLLSMDAAQRMRNQQMAMQARDRVAAARDQAFQLNELQPFQDQRAEGQALIGSGTQNIFGAIDSFSGAAIGQQNSGAMVQALAASGGGGI